MSRLNIVALFTTLIALSSRAMTGEKEKATNMTEKDRALRNAFLRKQKSMHLINIVDCLYNITQEQIYNEYINHINQKAFWINVWFKA